MSWEQLLDIAREAAEIRRIEETEPPVACPRCGVPLVERDGIRNCPAGGYQWPRDR